jgi:NAD(P)-dependent dehydrogenase (short-subunit alcohol dehydrogenase family)
MADSDSDTPAVPLPKPSTKVHTHLPPSTQLRQRTFQSYVTFDLIVRILSRSIFHPAICLIAYLCVAALHKHRTNVAYGLLYWSAFLMGIEILLYLNRRVAYGPPRTVDWNEEVVLITGGASGLGRILMEGLLMRGVKVAVLDVKDQDSEARDLSDGAPGELSWLTCDVSDPTAVQKAIDRVTGELGGISVLINNAAAPINALPLLPGDNAAKDAQNKTRTDHLNPQAAAQTFQINALSQFNVLHACVPHLRKASNGAHVVTVSSVLSHLAPSHLADYAASKAACTALHYSLFHEIRNQADSWLRENFKTVLVEVGQMDTSLFDKDRCRMPGWMGFWGPIVEGREVARDIIRMVESGEGGRIRAPMWAGVVAQWWGVVPMGVKRLARWITGVDGAVRRW